MSSSSCTSEKEKLRPVYKRGYGVWIREASIVYCLWRDTKVVCVALTVHPENSKHQVKRRMKTSTGLEEVLVPIPDAVYDYNQHMRGVDLSILPDKA